jgi:hypothetical protein
MEGSLWLDVLNAHVSRSGSAPPWDYHLFLNARSLAYKAALKVLKAFISQNPESYFTVPSGAYYILPRHHSQFINFFNRNFRMPPERPAREEMRVRPEAILDNDIPMDEAFYKRIGIPYDQMSEREQQAFEEAKDAIHEEFYGDIERFTDVGPLFITSDRATMNQFTRALADEARAIIGQRGESNLIGRHTRSYTRRP